MTKRKVIKIKDIEGIERFRKILREEFKEFPNASKMFRDYAKGKYHLLGTVYERVKIDNGIQQVFYNNRLV